MQQAVSDAAPATSPEALAALPPMGSYGALVKHMELAVKQLRRFRCKDIARHVNAKASDVHRVLQRWVKHGKVRKVGVTYFYEEAGC